MYPVQVERSNDTSTERSLLRRAKPFLAERILMNEGLLPMPQGLPKSSLPAHEPPVEHNSRVQAWSIRILVLVAVLIGAAMLTLSLKWPFTKQALVDVLQERSVRSVEIGKFRVTFFPPGCVAEQISFLHRKHKNKPPLITIQKLIVRGSYWGLIEPHKHLATVRIFGLHVTVPPQEPKWRSESSDASHREQFRAQSDYWRGNGRWSAA